MTVIKIDRDSEAGREFEHLFRSNDLRCVRFEFRKVKVEPGPIFMAVKGNEDMWSAALSVDSDGRGVYEPPPVPVTEVTGLECSDCGYIAWSIGDAKVHEEDGYSPGDHGGWDTITLNTSLEVNRS